MRRDGRRHRVLRQADLCRRGLRDANVEQHDSPQAVSGGVIGEMGTEVLPGFGGHLYAGTGWPLTRRRDQIAAQQSAAQIVQQLAALILGLEIGRGFEHAAMRVLPAGKQVHGLESSRFGLSRGKRLEDAAVAGAAGPFDKGQANLFDVLHSFPRLLQRGRTDHGTGPERVAAGGQM